jgi:hypothetical protein
MSKSIDASLKREQRNLVVALTLALVPFVLFLDKNTVDTNIYVFYAVQYLTMFGIGFRYADRGHYFFSPHFLAITYFSVNATFGSWGIIQHFEIWCADVFFEGMFHTQEINTYFLLCNLVVFLAYRPAEQENVERAPAMIKGVTKRGVAFLYLSLAVLILFSLVNIDLSLLGGAGDFSLIPKTIAAILLFYLAAKRKYRLRILLYATVIGVFAVTHFNSKREVIFLLFPVLLIESVLGNINIFSKFYKKILIIIPAVLLMLGLIAAMSIARGYGSFKVDNPIDALRYVPDYVQKDYFIEAFYNNLELSISHYNAMRAVEHIIQEPERLTLGSTITKVFFIPIPRKFYPGKPKSIITLYTSLQVPSFYNRGGSLPINIYAEMFWNFWWFGLIALYVLSRLLNHAYTFLVEKIRSSNNANDVLFLLFGYTYLMAYFRGSGLDLYIIYLAVAYLFCVSIQFFYSAAFLTSYNDNK